MSVRLAGDKYAAYAGDYCPRAIGIDGDVDLRWRNSPYGAPVVYGTCCAPCRAKGKRA